MRHGPGRRFAFTLMEAIAAMVILGVAIPPMLLAIRAYSGRRAEVALASQARWLAQERLEDAIADRHSPSRGYAWVAAANYPAEPAVSGFPRFARSVAATEMNADLSAAQPGSGIKLVTVTVSYSDPVGGTRSVALSTVVTEYTP